MSFQRPVFATFFIVFLFIFFFIFSVTNSLAAALDRAKEAGLLPHRAQYDIKLTSKKSGSQIVNISGKMIYEWQPSCDAWISNHSFDLMYEYADAPAVKISSGFSTYESFDGSSFNFTSQRKTNGEVFEELRGVADIAKDGGARASYTIPEDLIYDMPEGTLFPMGHTLAVLDQLKKGNKFFSASTFDGSDKEGPVEINTFLGKEAKVLEELKANKAVDQFLIDSRSWDLRLAFFPLNNSESQADYEMDLVFHENGVISDMLIDYGNFSVRQKMTGLEKLGDACNFETKRTGSGKNE